MYITSLTSLTYFFTIHMERSVMPKYDYEPITTSFKPTTWSEDIKGPFGLVSNDWEAFKSSVDDLSAKCPRGSRMVVVFLSRHGHGEHNIIHDQYKTWEQAKKVHTPHDASLAQSGILEATQVGEALKREYKKGMPVPESFFVSSLKRTGETCGLEWGWTVSENTGEGDRGWGVRATVVENLRESLSGGQHNSRSTKSHLATLFPTFTFPPEMTEEDELWVPETWDKEDEDKMVKRVGEGFEQCLELSEGCTYISITSHKTASERLRLFLGLEERVMGLCEMNILVLRFTEKNMSGE